MIDRKKFFDAIRRTLFGSLSQSQVDGINLILDYWDNYPKNKDSRHLAYMLATTYWETGKTMQPIAEHGGTDYLRSKKYYPYYGRGLVQLTWDFNYKLMTMIMRKLFPGDQIDFEKNPDQVMEWKYAIPIMFEGMFRGSSSRGDFTGKALEDYFNDTKDDPKGARRIINGTDKDDEIAAIHKHFLAALVDIEVTEPEPVEHNTLTSQMLEAESIMFNFFDALPNHPELATARLKMIEARLWVMEYERKYNEPVL